MKIRTLLCSVALLLFGSVRAEFPIDFGIIPRKSFPSTPIQLGIFPLQLFSSEADVYGLNFNTIILQKQTFGITTGLFSVQETQAGLTVSIGSFCSDNTGLSVAVYNLSDPISNIQNDYSFLNCQLGLINVADSGLQLGLINFNSRGLVPFCPIFNFSCRKESWINKLHKRNFDIDVDSLNHAAPTVEESEISVIEFDKNLE